MIKERDSQELRAILWTQVDWVVTDNVAEVLWTLQHIPLLNGLRKVMYR